MEVEIMKNENLCDQCKLNVSKYKCPKCTTKTCSLACSKAHKADDVCQEKIVEKSTKGFSEMDKSDDLNTDIVAQDQQFLTHCGSLLNGTSSDSGVPDLDVLKQKLEKSEKNQFNVDKNQEILLRNCQARRVWLSFDTTDAEQNRSRYERFSETIFWTISLQFCREIEGYQSEVYTVDNIADSVTVAALLNQFLKPKKFGSVISAGDLNCDKLEPFQSAGLEGLIIFMPVPGFADKRYYTVNTANSLLDNLRNCVIVNHPSLIVCLNNEADHYRILSEDEAQKIRHIQRQKRQFPMVNNNNDSSSSGMAFGRGRWRGRYSRGGRHSGNFRYRSRGRGRVRGGHISTDARKWPCPAAQTGEPMTDEMLPHKLQAFFPTMPAPNSFDPRISRPDNIFFNNGCARSNWRYNGRRSGQNAQMQWNEAIGPRNAQKRNASAETGIQPASDSNPSESDNSQSKKDYPKQSLVSMPSKPKNYFNILGD